MLFCIYHGNKKLKIITIFLLLASIYNFDLTRLKAIMAFSCFSCLKKRVLTSDVPDSLSGSGSCRILPFLSDIRFRPDLDMNKDPDPVLAGSWFKKKIRVRFRPDPNRDTANLDLVSKKEYTEKYFFQKQTLCKLKRVILYRWLNYISLLHASVIELICISSVKIKHLPW